VIPALVIRYGPALALAAGVGLAGWWVYGVIWQRGYDAHAAEIAAETAKRQAALDDLAADLRARAMALERAEQDRADLERELADEASDDPMAGDPGLGLDSLRRLNRIR
jgi:hypothetical protein